MWRPGEQVGGFELVARLREGGMATLFLARRRGATGERHVALKVVHPDLANDARFRQMFLDEARVAARIQHPNVVHVEELGQHRGVPFLAMEFVHGCSLAQLQRVLLARGRRLAPAFATRIAMQVAEGLHAAHETRDERGRALSVVHRDVTPENIMLAYGGQVKLIDFGIAKALGRRHRTQDGLLKGKFCYMAPEQALAKPVDRRVDIYQLGIVLWEMLTLRRLFDAEGDAALLASVQHPRVSPPRAIVPQLAPALDLAVMAALAPQPKRRPSDAQTFARMLAHAVPSALDVDESALHELLLAAMGEQRRRERALYPAGVFESLEQHGALAPAHLDAHTTGRSRLLHYTIEHALIGPSDAQLRSDAPTRGLGTSRARDRDARREPAHAVALAASLAGSSRTMRWRRRACWLGIGGVLVLALVLLGLRLLPERRPSPRPPPALPTSARAAR